MDYKDYYKILGVKRDADGDSIRQSYRRLARKYHPDVSKEPDAEDRFKELQEAYEVLRDPEKRKAYDQFGRYWKEGMEQGAAGAAGGAGQTGHRQEGFDPGEFADFDDFISSLFGERGFGRHRARGRDEHARLSISLEEAFRGGTRTISFDVLEPDPQGRVRTRTLNVNIPAGVTEGQRIRLAGQGQPGGGEPGDLYIELHIQPHPDYTLSGRDLYLNVPVTPWEAALGEKINLRTLGGTVKLTIPAGSRSGSKLKLTGRGLPGKPPGDLYAVLQIVTPAPRSDADRELYRKMAEAMPMNPRQG